MTFGNQFCEKVSPSYTIMISEIFLAPMKYSIYDMTELADTYVSLGDTLMINEITFCENE
jgi:hypothetical protein